MVVTGSAFDARNVVDSSTFYDLWLAFVTVKGMCLRKGRMGKMSGLGKESRLTMNVISY